MELIQADVYAGRVILKKLRQGNLTNAYFGEDTSESCKLIQRIYDASNLVKESLEYYLLPIISTY